MKHLQLSFLFVLFSTSFQVVLSEELVQDNKSMNSTPWYKHKFNKKKKQNQLSVTTLLDILKERAEELRKHAIDQVEEKYQKSSKSSLSDAQQDQEIMQIQADHSERIGYIVDLQQSLNYMSQEDLSFLFEDICDTKNKVKV